MTSMFSIYTLAIKFDCSFLVIFQSFYLFFSFIFDKLGLPLLNIRCKSCFKSLFSFFQCMKPSQSAKNVVFFFYSVCLWTWTMGGKEAIVLPLGYATANSFWSVNHFMLIWYVLHCCLSNRNLNKNTLKI